jgi:phosphomannomutase
MRGLREFAEREQPEELAAADGLRAQFSGRFWLLAPDPQEPVINVIVGAGSAQAAHDELDRLRQEVARLRDEAASQLRRP